MTEVHLPGNILRDLLEEYNITQDVLAHAMGVSRFSINQLINGRRTITAMMALRLGRATSNEPKILARSSIRI